MKHELTTEQIKTLAAKAPELKEYLKELAPSAFKPELVEFGAELTISRSPQDILFIGERYAPVGFAGKCLMWDTTKYNLSQIWVSDSKYQCLTIERL
jgi:hypothetical protein